MAETKKLLMVTVSGQDRPGITATFSRVMMEHSVELMDIEQTSLQNLLVLYFLLDLSNTSDSEDSVIKDLLFEASQLNLTLIFRLFSPSDVWSVNQRSLYVLTHFGGIRALAELSKILGEENVNIEMISSLTYHGALTGRITGQVIDAVQKARIVNKTSYDQGILLDQTVVVGDGANDALMLGQAGLGIAYNAKKRLDRAANVSLGRSRLMNILHFLGITEEDINEALASGPR
jgi:predicted amino acid-binding ACT domain protein